MLIHGSHKAKIHTYECKLKYTHSHALTLTREENANKYIFNVTRQPGGVEFKYFTTFIYIFKKKISSSRLYKQFSLRQPLSQVAAGSHQTEARASRPSHRLCGLVARLRRLGFRCSGGAADGAGWRCRYTSAAESLAGSCAPTKKTYIKHTIHLATTFGRSLTLLRRLVMMVHRRGCRCGRTVRRRLLARIGRLVRRLHLLHRLHVLLATLQCAEQIVVAAERPNDRTNLLWWLGGCGCRRHRCGGVCLVSGLLIGGRLIAGIGAGGGGGLLVGVLLLVKKYSNVCV